MLKLFKDFAEWKRVSKKMYLSEGRGHDPYFSAAKDRWHKTSIVHGLILGKYVIQRGLDYDGTRPRYTVLAAGSNGDVHSCGIRKHRTVEEAKQQIECLQQGSEQPECSTLKVRNTMIDIHWSGEHRYRERIYLLAQIVLKYRRRRGIKYIWANKYDAHEDRWSYVVYFENGKYIEDHEDVCYEASVAQDVLDTFEAEVAW